MLGKCYNKGMKKYIPVLALALVATPLCAQTSLQQVLPLLQKPTRTAAQTQQVLTLFRTAQDPNTVFAAGASLVRIPPAQTSEPALVSQIMRQDDALKSVFSAVILTAMGSVYEELSPLLQDAMQTQDPVLRAYVATAYGLINPQDTTHINDVVRMYIFDKAFAQRALNLMSATDKDQLTVLKKAANAQDPQLRAAAVAWLGSLHTPQALDILFKRAKKETDANVQAQLAGALAANPDATLEGTLKGLNVNYRKPTSTTYALALGFMTGNSVSALKNVLLSGKENQRINALRACAYMAATLSNPDAFAYSSDRSFDTHLLKGLIAQISALANNGTEVEKTYAQNALSQIEKLM